MEQYLFCLRYFHVFTFFQFLLQNFVSKFVTFYSTMHTNFRFTFYLSCDLEEPTCQAVDNPYEYHQESFPPQECLYNGEWALHNVHILTLNFNTDCLYSSTLMFLTQFLKTFLTLKCFNAIFLLTQFVWKI